MLIYMEGLTKKQIAKKIYNDTYKCKIHEQEAKTEIMRLAMIRLDKRLSEQKKNNCRILLQIHDELLFEVPTNEVKQIIKLIKEEMTSVAESQYHSFSTPLTVDINIGDNWGELH